MRAVLTGHLGRGPRTNSPMRSRLAAISLGYKQPKTRLRFGTKKPVRSILPKTNPRSGLKKPGPPSFFDKKIEDAIFLRAERMADGTRSFKLLEGEPLETNYGEDLYRQIFDLNGESQSKPSNGARSAIAI